MMEGDVSLKTVKDFLLVRAPRSSSEDKGWNLGHAVSFKERGIHPYRSLEVFELESRFLKAPRDKPPKDKGSSYKAHLLGEVLKGRSGHRK